MEKESNSLSFDDGTFYAHLDFKFRSFNLSEYLLLERFSRDLERLCECLVLCRRLLGDFVRDLDRPILLWLNVLSKGSKIMD